MHATPPVSPYEPGALPDTGRTKSWPWAVGGIFSFVSYDMAREDLAMMDAGVLDDRDRGAVSLMKTLGLVHILMVAFAVIAVCCAFAMTASSPRY